MRGTLRNLVRGVAAVRSINEEMDVDQNSRPIKVGRQRRERGLTTIIEEVSHGRRVRRVSMAFHVFLTCGCIAQFRIVDAREIRRVAMEFVPMVASTANVSVINDPTELENYYHCLISVCSIYFRLFLSFCCGVNCSILPRSKYKANSDIRCL